jgi:hypothetical protein
LPQLVFSELADQQFDALRNDLALAKRFKAVRAALGKMEINLRHPGLRTHEFQNTVCPHGKKTYEAYAENNTPGAYRIFWCYVPPPPNDTILIISITAHP